ncbi:MAG TPA: methyl-accepting chemotaxis protein [Bacilli bacterium]
MAENHFNRTKPEGNSLEDSVKKMPQQRGKTKFSNPIKSVGMKLFLMFFCSILFFVLVSGIFSYFISKGIIKEKVSTETLQTVTQTTEKLDIIFEGYEALSMQIFTDPLISESVAQMSDDKLEAYDKLDIQRSLSNKFNTYLFSDESLASISLFLADNKGVISNVSSSDVDITQMPWYKEVIEADGRLVWLETTPAGYIGTEKIAKFAFARLMKNTSSGKETGVLLLEVKMASLEAYLASVNIGEDSQLFIVDANNKIVYSKNAEDIEKTSKIPMNKEKDNSFTNDEDGNEVLLVSHRSDITGWTMVGTTPVDGLTKDAAKILNFTFIFALAAAVLAILIGYLVVRMIGRPLVELRNLMKQGEQGNLNVRTRFNSKDEIGQLGESFNQMMEQITILVQQTNQSAQDVLNTATQLADSSKKTALSSREISIATVEIAAGASTLALEAERGNELTHNIGVQMKNVIASNGQMGKSAAEVQNASEQGTMYMAELITKTSLTEEMTSSMITKVDKLKESTSSIRKILDVLNKMTKQTNILSLNATIEAARAGAAGKGFMVVADEIRKLADQSRQSIDIVGQITEKIQNEIDETVKVLSEAYPVFQQQINSVKEADVIFKKVQQHMGGFVLQLSDVTQSIEKLDKSQIVLSDAMSSVSAVSEESSATSEEVAGLSAEQLSISEGLVHLSDQLETLSTNLKNSLTRFNT